MTESNNADPSLSEAHKANNRMNAVIREMWDTQALLAKLGQIPNQFNAPHLNLAHAMAQASCNVLVSIAEEARVVTQSLEKHEVAFPQDASMIQLLKALLSPLSRLQAVHITGAIIRSLEVLQKEMKDELYARMAANAPMDKKGN